MSEEKQEFVVLPVGLMNDIVSYLSTKPHVEVEPYMVAIRTNAKLLPSEPTAEVAASKKV